MEAPKILVVEDEPDLRKLLRLLLERAGYSPFEAADGLSGIRVFHQVRPDLVVLDLGLPCLNGWDVLSRIRELGDTPVIVLSARGLELEIVRGLNSGADDYVTKPFGHTELIARVNAALRRQSRDRRDEFEIYSDGRMEVDFVRREVRWNGTDVVLTPLEYRLASMLVRHAGQVLSAEQLLERVWDDPTSISPSRVKFAILRLRRKLDDGSGVSPITSVRGFGYRFDPFSGGK